MQVISVCTHYTVIIPKYPKRFVFENLSSHKNVAVRRACSSLLVTVVERMGPGRVLSGVKDVTDKILPVTAQFLCDASPETR